MQNTNYGGRTWVMSNTTGGGRGRDIQKVGIFDSFQTDKMVASIKVFYSPTDAQVNCIKNNFKINIKTAPKCFGAVSHTIIRERISRAC